MVKTQYFLGRGLHAICCLIAAAIVVAGLISLVAGQEHPLSLLIAAMSVATIFMAAFITWQLGNMAKHLLVRC